MSAPITLTTYGQHADLQKYVGHAPETSGSIYLSGSAAAEKVYFNTNLRFSGSDGFTIENLKAPSNASDAATKAYVDAQVTAQDLDFQGDSGGALNIDLDSETLTIAGGSGLETAGADNTLTVAVSTGGITNAMLAGSIANNKLANSTFEVPAGAGLAGGGAGSLGGASTALAVHVNGLTEKASDAVAADMIAIADSEDSSGSKKISVTNLVDLMDGTGLTAASGVLSVDASQNQITSATSLAAVGTIATGVWNGTAIASAYIAADAITGAKIADDAIDSEHLADGSIDLAHMSANSVDSDQYVDGSIDTAHLGNLQVTTGKLAADAVTNAKIADDAVDTENIADDAITAALIDDGAVVTAALGADAVTAAKLADSAVVTANIVDGNVTTAKLADSNVTNAKLANSSLTVGSTSVSLGGTSTSLAGLTGLDFTAANASVAASLGAYTLTLGGAASTVALANDVTIAGDLTVNGDTVTVNSTVVAIDDKVMVFASGSTDGQIATANGAGFAIGGDAGAAKLASFLYDGVDRFDVSDHLNLASSQELKINNASVLSATTLGSSVVGSSLTSVGTIASGVWNGTAIASGYIAADAITGAKIADDAVDSEHLADGSIDLAHMSANSVDSDQYVDGSIDTAHLGDLQVTTGKLAADAVTAAKLADSAVVTANIVDANVTTAKLAADAVTAAKLADSAVVTANIVDANVTTAKIANDAVTAAKLADTAVTAASYGGSLKRLTATVDAQGRLTAMADATIQNAAADGSTKGVAAFDADDFDASSGVITLGNSASGAVLGVSATANETSVSRSNGAVTVGLADDVTIPSDLTITDGLTLGDGDITAAQGAAVTGQMIAKNDSNRLIGYPLFVDANRDWGIMTGNPSGMPNGSGKLTLTGSLVVNGAGLGSGAYAVDVANANSSIGRVRANAFVTYSARELKKDIKDISNPMAKLSALRPVTYNWRGTDAKSKGWNSEEVGFIADEVQQVLPQIVQAGPDGKAQGIDYSKLTAVLTQAVKNQDQEIQDLKAQLSKVLNALELKG